MFKASCTLILVIGFILFIASINPGYATFVGVVAAVVIGLLIWMNRRNKVREQESLLAGLTAQAFALENLGKAGFSSTANFALEKGEKLIYECHGMQLAEHKSAGSTYTGANAGVSVPLFGRVRGNIGGSKGNIVRKPEQLTIIDAGDATFTTKRVIFTGSQQTRVWELDKVLDFEPGINGLWVSISTSNASHTSQLQIPDVSVIAPGVLMDIAMDANRDGEEAAISKVNEYAVLLRKTVAEQQALKK